tara:strand:+ start:371 stop:712 length:342 start_codon:yes stop_codon:yes gene_type:complete
MNLKKLNDKIDKFVSERKWEKFHTPKNLIMALSGEVGELNECFQWLNNEDIEKIKESPNDLIAVEHEIADVFIYLVRIAHKMDIDIENVVNKKMKLNEIKYPIDKNLGAINKI